jgi:putative redox protein
MQAKVSLVEGMAFDATAGSGHTVRVDSSPDVGGQNRGPRPMELLLLGLGSCTAMDVISILRKMRQDVTAYEVNVSGERAEQHPMVFTRIFVEHVVTGRNLSDALVKKAVQLSEHKYCGASAMLGKVAQVEHTCRVVEAATEDVADQAPIEA